MTRYQLAQKKRQKVLDYLNANPHCTSAEIATATGIVFDDTRSQLRRMRAEGEVGRNGAEKEYRYYATTKKTISAKEMQKRSPTGKAAKVTVKIAEDGKPAYIPALGLGQARYVHTPSDKPLVGRGGQGALRGRVWVAPAGAIV